MQSQMVILLLAAATLLPDPKNPRKVADGQDSELLLLSQDLKKRGCLVPLIVKRRGDVYMVIDGHRRRAAALLAGIEKLPCRVFEENVSDAEIREAQLVLPLHAQGLTPYEVYCGAKNWLSLHPGSTAKHLAQAINRSESYVSMILSLDRCCDEIKKAAAENKICMNDWYALSKEPEPRQRELLAARLNGASTKEISRLRKKSDKPTVRMPKVKIPLCNDTAAGVVTVAGENIDLNDTETLLKEALRAVRSAKDKNLDCRTAQSVWRDMASKPKAGGNHVA